MSWPAALPKDNTFDGLASSLDIVPSSVAAAGINPPTDRKIDGVNLLPFLKSEKTDDPREFLCWQQRQWERPN